MKPKSLLAQYMWKYKLGYLFGITFLLITNLGQMYVPKITGELTDGLTYGTLNLEGVQKITLSFIIIAFTIFIGRICWRIGLIKTSRKIERDLRAILFHKFLRLDVTYFNSHKTGELMAYAINDIGAVKQMTGMGIVLLYDAFILSGMVIYNMFMEVNIELTLITLIPMFLIAIAGTYARRTIRTRFIKKQKAFAQLTDVVQESFAGIKVIKAFVREKYHIGEFEKQVQRNYDANISVFKVMAIMQPSIGLLVGISMLIAIGYGGYLTIIEQISVGDFVTFNGYIWLLVWPMAAIGQALNVYTQGSAAIKRLSEVMDVPEIILDNEEDIVDESPLIEDGSISIKDFTFNFPDNQNIGLKNINLEVEDGTTLAILGRTGSGKSTLVNVLLRFYNVDQDKIFLGGTDIMKLRLKTVRHSISYVPQDNYLFSASVKDNIGFGLDKFTSEQIEEAAKRANVHNNIINFQNQYDTLVGENGTMLSGGQKQRISIARALALKAPILILDDSLSAVDTHTEETILKNLKEVRSNKTNIIIAHRISTVRNADKIIVMDKGSIAEEGTHESLLAQRGLYYEMYEQQKLEGRKSQKNRKYKFDINNPDVTDTLGIGTERGPYREK
ncbi:ABC transporter ATP-binding protein [Candidatus Epulonipiscium viviparus]|uniref:ABC transporter ATP-binding protein n=1 Tax=Candidatus Epulonipiscium viviparus TaxID=420336 RepID=UPI00016C0B60|nr:ABC transporter ATP-binding protein [Candidatus Epulopiscium viviparus]